MLILLEMSRPLLKISIRIRVKRYPNSLFFALKGEHFDAHQYLEQAVEQGATALVVQQANTQITTPQLVVADTRLALGQLAKWLREKINPRTVAMTGHRVKLR